jgi:multidrug resistance efflux pump
MKLTIRKTLLFSLGLFVLLAFAALAVTFFRINRTVIVDGAFRYRESYSVTVEEAGFVDQVLVETDSRVQKGDVLAVLTNRDLAREIAGMERRISMGVLELANMEEQEASLLFATAQDVLSLEESLNTKTFELEYRGDLHEMNEKLYRDGSITKERHDASRLAYRSIQGAVAELNILRSKKLRVLEDLKVSPSPARAIKLKALEIDRDQLEYLKSRQERLTIRASESGVLLAEVWKALEASYLARGTHIADIVSFDDIDFVGYTKDSDIIRIREGQVSYFDVEIFRRKVFVNGRVTNIGYKAVDGPGTSSLFPVTIEIGNKKFFDRDQEFYIQAGVKGQAVIIVEESLSLITLIWEKILNFTDFGVYTE